MSSSGWRVTSLDVGRAREYVKLGVRSVLQRRGLDLVRDPFPARVAATLSWLGISNVLDVGANIGQYATALRSSGYRGRIVSCEPLPDAFTHLSRRSRRDPQWDVIQAAVGESTGTTTINVSANSYSSSLLSMTETHVIAAPGSGYVSAAQVPMTTVLDIVADRRIPVSNTLLKIDTQGYEASVLEGAGDLVGQLPAITLELSYVPLYEGQKLYSEISSLLVASGYLLWSTDPGFGDPTTGRMLQCDALFVRSDLADSSRIRLSPPS